MKDCRICKVSLIDGNCHEYKVKLHRICKTCENTRVRAQNLRCKTETIEQYGGKCVCCDEPNLVFLTIDHISENGAEERKTLNKNGGSKFYRWLKKMSYPKTNYQVLCFNCNFAKHVLGRCPYQDMVKTVQFIIITYTVVITTGVSIMSSTDKLAQKRNLTDRIKQRLNIGDAAMGWLDPTYKKFRNDLIATDKAVRLKAMRLNEFRREADKSFKQKNYLYAATQVGLYYDLIHEINETFNEQFATFDPDEIKLMVDHLDPQSQQYIINRFNRNKKAEFAESRMQKTAAFDWLRNLVYTRRRAVSILEKNFGARKIKVLRDGLAIAINKLNVLHEIVMGKFEEMSTVLAAADFDKYRDVLGQLFVATNVHDKEYDEFFKKSVEPYHAYISEQMAKVEKMRAEQAESARSVEELAQADAKQQMLMERAPEDRKNFDERLNATPGVPGRATGPLIPSTVLSPMDTGPMAHVPGPTPPAPMPHGGPTGPQLGLPGMSNRPSYLDMPPNLNAPAQVPAPAAVAPSNQLGLDFRTNQQKTDALTDEVLNSKQTAPATAFPAAVAPKAAPKAVAPKAAPKAENAGRRIKVRNKAQPDENAADAYDYYVKADHSALFVKLAGCDTKAEMIESLLSYSAYLDSNEEELDSLKVLAIAEGLMESI